MILSEQIARLIEDMLTEQGGTLEIGRNELASKMGCVPSQINYVITSRFTPQKGYIVETRRGGGGYMRISRVQFDKNSYLMQFYNAVGDSIDYESSKVFIRHLTKNNIITPREEQLILAPLSESALTDVRREDRDKMRAVMLKAVVLKLATM
ncbi:MAG: CtsR family transcriptional regulator [Firmicutes bacterium]|nr:CtsR family transcriptional regulator [Bacillota bacterium]